jgi:endonuclease YncB( thermonuclease family)
MTRLDMSGLTFLKHLALAAVTALLLACGGGSGGDGGMALAGRVSAVTDGDTLTLLATDASRQTIRLAGIDAPEKDQPFGTEARANLVKLALDREAIVEFHKRDVYGRLVGKVWVDGVDINLEQVRAGLAWHYKEYQSEQSPADRVLYAAEEVRARAAARGLWSAPAPVPPWDWRK